MLIDCTMLSVLLWRANKWNFPKENSCKSWKRKLKNGNSWDLNLNTVFHSSQDLCKGHSNFCDANKLQLLTGNGVPGFWSGQISNGSPHHRVMMQILFLCKAIRGNTKWILSLITSLYIYTLDICFKLHCFHFISFSCILPHFIFSLSIDRLTPLCFFTPHWQA